MINFIKNLLGLNKPTETVKEILTPPAPYKIEPPAVNKVTAIGESGAAAVAAAKAPKPANKQRKPYYKNKPKAKPAVTEGTTKGGNNTVKPAQVAKAKPSTPPKPKAKRK